MSKVPEEALAALGVPESQISKFTTYQGKGCQNCNHSGYRGRTGLFEVMEITPKLQDLVLSGSSTSNIRAQSRKEGMLTLREIGVLKIKAGVTTLEEVLRETAVQ